MALWLKRAAFALAALYITLSPALPQLLGWGAPVVRAWTMYSGVGAGLPKGDFTARYADGRIQTLTALQVRGLERYPDVFHYTFDGLIDAPEGLAAWAADFCAASQDLESLSFSGRIGSPDGWVTHDADDLCAGPALVAEAGA